MLSRGASDLDIYLPKISGCLRQIISDNQHGTVRQNGIVTTQETNLIFEKIIIVIEGKVDAELSLPGPVNRDEAGGFERKGDPLIYPGCLREYTCRGE